MKPVNKIYWLKKKYQLLGSFGSQADKKERAEVKKILAKLGVKVN